MDQNLIARHAFIRAGMQRDHIAGRRTPLHIQQELQRIEAKAQAMYTPMELQQAIAASTTMQAQYLQQHDARAAMQDATAKSFYADKLAKDLTGLTADQLLAAKAGKPIPMQGKGKVTYKDNLRQLMQANGLPEMPFEKFAKVAERVEEIELAGRDPGDYLREKFGAKAAAAHTVIGGFNRSGIGIEMALRGDPEPDHYVKPTDDLQRKATIADAWARKAAGDKADFDSLTTDIHPSYLESDTSQGDVARSFHKHEMEELAKERASYTPASYDIDENSEVDRYAEL